MASFKGIEPIAAALRARDGYDQALLNFCIAVTGPVRPGAVPRKLYSRLQRYRVWLAVVCNHYQWQEGVGPRPTLALLQGQSEASPRQLSDLVRSLHAGGHVAVEMDPSDGRQRLLVPQPSMVLALSEPTRLYLDLHDDVSGASERWRDSANVDLIGRLLARAFREAPPAEVIVARFPLVFGCAAQDCGFHILCAVMLVALGGVPEGASEHAPLSLPFLAERNQVSKAHVGAFLETARRSGLFAVVRGRLEGPPRHDLIREFAEFVSINACTFRLLLDQIGPLASQPHQPLPPRQPSTP